VRTIRALVLGLIASLGGCYLAHERAAPIDGGSDTSTPAPCVVRCPAAVLLGSTGALDSTWQTPPLLGAVVTPDAILVLTLLTPSDVLTELEMVPVVFRVDPSSGTVTRFEDPASVHTHEPLQGGDLRLVGGALQASILQTSLNTFRRRDARVGQVVWSLDGAVTAERDTMAAAPFMLRPSEEARAGAFGSGAQDLAMFAEGSVVHAFVVVAGVTTTPPALVDLVSLPDDGALAPLSGTVLADGTLVIAGGGGIRAPFLARGQLADAPLATEAVFGERFDPAPQVVTEPGGFALVRFASDPTDLASSALRVQHRGLDGALSGELAVATTNGVAPTQLAIYPSASGVGLAWSEVPIGAPATADVRVIPSGIATAACAGRASAEPVARLDAPPTAMIAAADPSSDAAAFFVVVHDGPPPVGQPVIDVYHVDHCSYR
jgi:hypothetical protein